MVNIIKSSVLLTYEHTCHLPDGMTMTCLPLRHIALLLMPVKFQCSFSVQETVYSQKYDMATTDFFRWFIPVVRTYKY